MAPRWGHTWILITGSYTQDPSVYLTRIIDVNYFSFPTRELFGLERILVTV